MTLLSTIYWPLYSNTEWKMWVWAMLKPEKILSRNVSHKKNAHILTYMYTYIHTFINIYYIYTDIYIYIYGHFFRDLHYGIEFFPVSAWLTLTFFTQCYCTKVYILLKEVSTKFYKHFRLSLYTARSVVKEKIVTYITG